MTSVANVHSWQVIKVMSPPCVRSAQHVTVVRGRVEGTHLCHRDALLVGLQNVRMCCNLLGYVDGRICVSFTHSYCLLHPLSETFDTFSPNLPAGLVSEAGNRRHRLRGMGLEIATQTCPTPAVRWPYLSN